MGIPEPPATIIKDIMPADYELVERLALDFMRLSSEAVTTETWVETLAATLALVSVTVAEYSDAKVTALVRKHLNQCREKKRRDASNTTITIPEICLRLGLSQETVYEMLKAGDIPNIRRRRLFIVSRAAYEDWEKTIGKK
jgi:excisionase family DNA binding protein